MEQGRFQQEQISEQFASILKAKNKVIHNIWATIPAAEKLTFQMLETRLERNPPQDYADLMKFWGQFHDVMKISGSALNARLRQNLVSTAFSELVDRYKDWDGTPVVLFNTSENNEQSAIINAFQFEQDVYEDATKAYDEQARQDIITAVIEKDQLHNTPLVHPRHLAPGLIVTTSSVGMHKIITPTMIDGVTLRLTYPQATSTPIVEFVPEIAA